MRYHSPVSDRGAVTAELAIGIPTVLGLVSVLLGALRFGMDGVAATTLASQAALSIARGESSDTALDAARRSLPAANWTADSTTGPTCVTATIPNPLPGSAPMIVRQCVPI